MSIGQTLKHIWDVATGNNRIDELQLGLKKTKALSTIFAGAAIGALTKGFVAIHLFTSATPLSWGGVAEFAAGFTAATVVIGQAESLYAAHKHRKNQGNGPAPQQPL